MESQDKEEEYKQSVWEIYRKEYATANREKKAELKKRMNHWQELMKSGMLAIPAYTQVMEEESDDSPIYMAIEEESDNRVKEERSSKPPNHSFWAEIHKAPLVILGLALVAAFVYIGVISGDRNAINTELESVQLELGSTKQTLTSTQVELNSLNDTLASMQVEIGHLTDTLNDTIAKAVIEINSLNDTLTLTQSELGSTKQTLASAQNELETTKAELEAEEAKNKLYQETFGANVYAGKQPQVTGRGSVGSPNIINNPTAKNVSWGQLESFLLFDPTDDETYSLNTFNCVSFSEMLHNNAEAAGIKSAFVSIRFKDEAVGHTLNAFKTTDKGLIYVDSTGAEKWSYGQDYSMEWDKIVYVVKGKEYTPISLGPNTPLNYDAYEKMKADWGSYFQKLEAYDKEVKEFNREIFLKVYYIGTPEWERIKQWERTLKEQEGMLKNLRAQLEFVWEPLGIVTTIEIYW